MPTPSEPPGSSDVRARFWIVVVLVVVTVGVAVGVLPFWETVGGLVVAVLGGLVVAVLTTDRATNQNGRTGGEGSDSSDGEPAG